MRAFAACAAVAASAVSLGAAADAAGAAGNCHLPAPAFLWSGVPLTVAGRQVGGVGEASVYLAAPLEGREVAEALAGAASKTADAVEVLVLVAAQGDALSTSAVAAAAVGGGSLHFQTANAVMPYVYPSAELPSRSFAAACAAAGVSVTEVTLEGLKEELASLQAKSLLSDGKTDAFAVMLPADLSAAEVDASLAKAWAALAAAAGAGGRAALAFVTDAAAPNCGRLALQAQDAVALGQRRRRLASETTTYRTLLITPDILTALLFLLLFFFILITGVGCLNDIECPKVFVHTGPPPGQEY